MRSVRHVTATMSNLQQKSQLFPEVPSGQKDRKDDICSISFKKEKKKARRMTTRVTSLVSISNSRGASVYHRVGMWPAAEVTVQQISPITLIQTKVYGNMSGTIWFNFDVRSFTFKQFNQIDRKKKRQCERNAWLNFSIYPGPVSILRSLCTNGPSTAHNLFIQLQAKEQNMPRLIAGSFLLWNLSHCGRCSWRCCTLLGILLFEPVANEVTLPTIILNS